MTLFPLEKVKESIKKVLTDMPVDKKTDYNLFKIVMTSEYLKSVGLTEEAKKLSAIIDAEKYEENLSKLTGSSKLNKIHGISYVTQYLTAM